MDKNQEINRLYWKCRRGMLELDLYFRIYLEKGYPGASVEEKQLFERLLDEVDTNLLAWFTGQETPPDPKLHEFIKILQTVCRS